MVQPLNIKNFMIFRGSVLMMLSGPSMCYRICEIQGEMEENIYDTCARWWLRTVTFQEHPNESNGVANHHMRQWPLCGEITGHRWIPRTKASNAENVSIWWRNHKVLGHLLHPDCHIQVPHIYGTDNWSTLIKAYLHLPCHQSHEG